MQFTELYWDFNLPFDILSSGAQMKLSATNIPGQFGMKED